MFNIITSEYGDWIRDISNRQNVLQFENDEQDTITPRFNELSVRENNVRLDVVEITYQQVRNPTDCIYIICCGGFLLKHEANDIKNPGKVSNLSDRKVVKIASKLLKKNSNLSYTFVFYCPIAGNHNSNRNVYKETRLQVQRLLNGGVKATNIILHTRFSNYAAQKVAKYFHEKGERVGIFCDKAWSIQTLYLEGCNGTAIRFQMKEVALRYGDFASQALPYSGIIGMDYRLISAYKFLGNLMQRILFLSPAQIGITRFKQIPGKFRGYSVCDNSEIFTNPMHKEFESKRCKFVKDINNAFSQLLDSMLVTVKDDDSNSRDSKETTVCSFELISEKLLALSKTKNKDKIIGKVIKRLKIIGKAIRATDKYGEAYPITADIIQFCCTSLNEYKNNPNIAEKQIENCAETILNMGFAMENFWDTHYHSKNAFVEFVDGSIIRDGDGFGPLFDFIKVAQFLLLGSSVAPGCADVFDIVAKFMPDNAFHRRYERVCNGDVSYVRMAGGFTYNDENKEKLSEEIEVKCASRWNVRFFNNVGRKVDEKKQVLRHNSVMPQPDEKNTDNNISKQTSSNQETVEINRLFSKL